MAPDKRAASPDSNASERPAKMPKQAPVDMKESAENNKLAETNVSSEDTKPAETDASAQNKPVGMSEKNEPAEQKELIETMTIPTDKKPSRFPHFEDGDVSMSLGVDLTLKLHGDKLRSACKLFADFDKLPVRFNLPTSDDVFATVVRLDTSDTNETSPSKNTRAVCANEAVFRYLYQQPVEITALLARGVTVLATRYGCLPAIKDALTMDILEASLGTRLFQDMPMPLLTAGYYLQNKRIFSEAMVHAVGHGLMAGEADKTMPSVVQKLLDLHQENLMATIDQHWAAMFAQLRSDNLPRLIASSFIREYISRNNLQLGHITKAVYNTMNSLRKMNSNKELLNFRTIQQVCDIDNGLQSISTFTDLIKNFDEEEYRDDLCAADAAFQCCVNPQSVEAELNSALERIKKSLIPLFKDDRDLGYFTRPFDGKYPWENDTEEESASSGTKQA
ncbi:uncharacterized protein K452DRAFT_288504 [Aplosporella prunicola CBS 121167]|uniref:BTB domain-containing protein n=1 Tax=Aplosporella prunicola CBS 121167 TaxID=1176127 RepID=A0A6A6BDY5_9PEZI|nr:uncharacterized protein K452DRAFT_288504 [Aplosporella prunicola CBS 121167]KAF2141137.1 hypothetical protein K452DRAFT_288504 [Aplosporella prunicola CBS 121167]